MYFILAIYFNSIPSLSLQSPDELMEMAHKYYVDTALPKLVSFLILNLFISKVNYFGMCLVIVTSNYRWQILDPLNSLLLMDVR